MQPGARQRSEGAPAERGGPSRAGRAQSRWGAGRRWRRQRAPRERRGGEEGADDRREGLLGKRSGGGTKEEAVPEERAPSGGLVLPAEKGPGSAGSLDTWGEGAGGMDAKGSCPRGSPAPQCGRPSGRLGISSSTGSEGPLPASPRIATALYLSEESAPSHYSAEQGFRPHRGGRKGVPELHPTPPGAASGAEGGRGHPQGGPRAVVNPTQVGQRLGRWKEGRPQAAGLLGRAGICRTEGETAPLSPGRCQTWSSPRPQQGAPSRQRG